MRLPVIMIASLLLARPASMWSFEASDDGNLEIVSRYLDATRTQQAALRGAQMEVDIDAKLPRLAKQGKLRALRKISTTSAEPFEIPIALAPRFPGLSGQTASSSRPASAAPVSCAAM